MLNMLRKRENMKKIMWALAILIIPAFVLWGSSSSIRSRGLPKYAGRIFGKKVSFQQFQASLRACHNQGLLTYGENFRKIAKLLNLEEEAWERIILLRQAKKEGIEVSDQEVITFIQDLPPFQKDGRFDKNKYTALLDYAFRTNASEFEKQIREMLKINKLVERVTESAEVNDEEIKEAYKSENEKLKAVYAFFNPLEFTDQVPPLYEAIQDYYQNHKNEFRQAEQVNIDYITLAFDDKNKERMEDKIWQISDEIEDKDSSFEETAEKNNLEIKGTGFFGQNQVIPEIGLSYEFSNAAFTLGIGEVSNVIETPKGYFIIKIKEKKAPMIPPLEEIREKVERAVIREKSWKFAKEKAQEMLPQIRELMEKQKLNFKKACAKLSLTIKETEEFSKFGYISGIGQSPEFSSAAFALAAEEISDVVSVPNGYCILEVTGRIPIDEEKFKEAKEKFAEILLTRKKDRLFKLWLTHLKGKADLQSNIQNAP